MWLFLVNKQDFGNTFCPDWQSGTRLMDFSISRQLFLMCAVRCLLPTLLFSTQKINIQTCTINRGYEICRTNFTST